MSIAPTGMDSSGQPTYDGPYKSPPRGSRSGGNWWETPNLGNRDFAAGRFQTPDWAIYPASGFTADDPNAFYNSYQGVDPQLRGSWGDNLRAGFTTWSALQGDRDAGTALLEDRSASAQDSFDAWQADPYRAAVMTDLENRMSPDYSFLTDPQRASYDLQIAQNAQRQRRSAASSAASRGAGFGGARGSQDVAIDAYAANAGMSLQATLDATNQQMRNAASTEMGRLTGAFEGVDVAYQKTLDQLAAEEARILTSTDYVPADFAVWDELAFAFDEADRESQRAADSIAQLDRATEKDWFDYASLLLEMAGTGVLKGVASFADNLIGGLLGP